MKTKKIFLAAIFLCGTIHNTTQPESGMFAKFITATVITACAIPTTYLTYKFYQAGGDTQITKRLVRQDKNAVCTRIITKLQKECKSDDKACKELIQCLEQARSPLTQIMLDDAQQAVDDSRKALRKTQVYKDAKDSYCNASEELKKSKKVNEGGGDNDRRD